MNPKSLMLQNETCKRQDDIIEIIGKDKEVVEKFGGPYTYLPENGFEMLDIWMIAGYIETVLNKNNNDRLTTTLVTTRCGSGCWF